MPIPIFASYTWQETESTVTISARIPGATPSNTDFFASPHYVKANCSQGGGSGLFLLEVDLLAEIDAKRSSAIVKTGGEVEIKLHKQTAELWGQLAVQALDKAERMRRRKRSIEAAERAAAADAEEQKRAVWEKSRFTLSSQMQMEREYRGVLEGRKAAEKAREEAELDAWQSVTEQARLEELRARYGVVAAPATVQNGGIVAGNAAAAASGGEAQGALAVQAARAAQAAKPLPPVRARTVIEATFTPKMTAAPLRTKGRAADYDPEPVPLEAPGLLQGAHSGEQATGSMIGPSRARTLKAGDLYDISQRDPAWLKDRGDRFYRLRDYAAALNSYSAVLAQFADKIPAQAVDTYLACLSNRAACRLQRGECLEAAADATHALALAQSGKSISNVPLSDEQLKQRARTRQLRLLMRRGAALARLGALEQAATDFELALSDFAPEGGLVDHGNIGAPSELGDGAVRAQMREDLAAIKERLAELLRLKGEADAEAAAAAAAAAQAEAGVAAAGDVAEPPASEPPADGSAREEPASELARVRASRALALYGEALALGASHVPTLANAAAAALAAGAHARCVSLCDSALKIADAGVVTGALCPVRTRVKLLLRRSTAKCELGHWKGAHADLRRASAFAPSDTSIAMQLRAVCNAAREHGVELGDGGAALSAISATSSAAILAHDAASAGAADGGSEAAGEAAAEAGGGGGGGGGSASASDLKGQADRAFAAGSLEAAVALYGEALRADAAAEWSQLAQPAPDAGSARATAEGESAAAAAAAGTDADPPSFVPAASYGGHRPGYVFTTREGLLGYHRDALPGQSAAPAPSQVPSTVAVDVAGDASGGGDAAAAHAEPPAVVIVGAPADEELASIIRPAEAPKGGVLFRCQCLSNRAACLLKLGDFARAIDDCTAAMAAVKTLRAQAAALTPSSAGTQLSRDALLLKLLLRRAAAYVELGRMEDALAEYEEAHELAPENGAVKDALRQLRARA